MKAYTLPGKRLHSAYGFDFLYSNRLTPALVRDALHAWPSDGRSGWPSWAFSNHDAPRAVSRWTDPAHREAFARVSMLLISASLSEPSSRSPQVSTPERPGSLTHRNLLELSDAAELVAEHPVRLEPVRDRLGDDFDGIALLNARCHYNTSGASETIFM